MNRELKLLFGSNAVFTLAAHLLIPVYALYIFQAGGGPELAGLLYATIFVSSAITDLVIIKFQDRRNLGLKMLKLNFLVRGLTWGALAFINTIPAIFVAQVVIGITQAIGSSAFNSLVSEHLDGQKHIKEWGTWDLVASPAVALGSVMGGIIAGRFGFSMLFMTMGVLACISLGLLFRYRRPI